MLLVRTATTAAESLSLGIVVTLVGETLDLPITRQQWTSLDLVMARR